MRFCRTILFFFPILGINAQQLSFFKPDNLKQLPSSECYNIIQDSKGYIWFSTEGGLCRYNGNVVRVFAADEGLPEGSTYTLAEDRNGKIWMTTSKNRVLYLDRAKDSILEPRFSKIYAAGCNKVLLQTYNLLLEGDSALWLNTQHTTRRINLRTNAVTTITPADSAFLIFYAKPWGLIQLKRLVPPEFRARIYHKKILPLAFHKKTRLAISVPYTKDYSPETRVLTSFNKRGEYFITFGHYLLKVNADGTYRLTEFDYPVLCVYSDKKDGLWIGLHKGGVLYFPDPYNDDYKIASMQELSVTGVCEDAEKGVWCTTLEKGVFYCRNKSVLTYNIVDLEKRAEFLKVINDHLYTSSKKNELIEIYGNSIRKHEFTNGPMITDMICYGDSMLITGKMQMFKTDTAFRKQITLLDTRNLATAANHVVQTPGHRFFSINHSSLFEIIGTRYVERIERLEKPARAFLATQGGRLLIGCTEGLFDVDQQNYSVKKISGVSGSVSCILETKSDGIWVSTKEHGIYVLEKYGAKKINDLLRLPTDRFNNIAQDPRGDLWLASNIGLIHLSKPFGKQPAKVYNALNGLNSTEILQVAVTTDRVFLSTYEGLCSFPLGYDLSNNTSPSIYVKRVKVNENLADLSAKPEFAWNENNLKILYDVLTFKQAGLPVKLFYRVEGLDDQAHYMEGRELLLSNLSPGPYKVMMFALNNDNKPSSTPAVLEFTIKKPFWLTPLFILASLLVLIAMIFVIVNRIIMRIQKKEEEKTRINKLLAEYQMSALRAQMNPHFIFNCINSIQRYILTNKAEEAYNYLAKFSKLIRLVLNYADENLISLAEELEIIELYIELEQLRFENKFTYRIEVVGDLDTNGLTVPVMIMQPYIENAIWHGLMNLDKGKAGHIYIRLSFEQDALRVLIEDNGIGIEKASKLKKKGHLSKGTQINSRRAEILNIMSSGMKGSVVIEDIRLNGEVQGTRVIITIPQNYATYE